MGLTLDHYTDADLETLRAIVSEPELADHFDKFVGPDGVEDKLRDPRLARDALRIARVDGEPAGFGVLWRLPQASGTWAMTRVGVRARFRGRGVGRALAEAMLASARQPAADGPLELGAAAWQPEPAADALAARLGFVHARWFWLMARPRGGCPEPAWPEGVRVRAFDRTEAMLADWTDVYNDSFSGHYRYVRAAIETTRALVTYATFRPDGLLIAYRDDRPVGFCRNDLHATRGELSTLGVAHDHRGIGLGRALLRWGVRWLEGAGTLPVTLLVDGENESALTLYRSEGFEVTRTRRIWELPARR